MNEHRDARLTAVDALAKGVREVLGPIKAPGFICSLVNHHGSDTGRIELETKGILIRAGRAGFTHWLVEHYSTSNWDKPEFRFQTTRKKISTGLVDICAHFSQEFGATLLYENLRECWSVHMFGKGNFNGEEPALLCSYLWGFLQEYTRWAGLGKFYPIHETQCRHNSGQHCILEISKETID